MSSGFIECVNGRFGFKTLNQDHVSTYKISCPIQTMRTMDSDEFIFVLIVCQEIVDRANKIIHQRSFWNFMPFRENFLVLNVEFLKFRGMVVFRCEGKVYHKTQVWNLLNSIARGEAFFLAFDEKSLCQRNFQGNELSSFDLGADAGVIKPSVRIFACHIPGSRWS